MYKFGDNQIRFEDFEQPVGMKMSKENRWVKKAELIPWGKIEKRYAALFRNKKGNVAKPLRLALGACIIQAEYGYSDEETALQIQEGPYLQFFCGYSGFEDGRPFDASLMVYFRKCGLGTIYTRLKETAEHSVALAVVVLNLRKIFRRSWRLLFEFFFLTRKLGFVQ